MLAEFWDENLTNFGRSLIMRRLFEKRPDHSKLFLGRLLYLAAFVMPRYAYILTKTKKNKLNKSVSKILLIFTGNCP